MSYDTRNSHQRINTKFCGKWGQSASETCEMPSAACGTETTKKWIVLAWQKLFNPLKTKRRRLYLKTQSVPRSKHFSSRL